MPDVTDNFNSLSRGVSNLARDAAYVAVGLGVLGYQRVQVHRVELQNRLSEDLSIDQHFDDVREGVAKSVRQIDDLTESAVRLIESTLQPLEERLPPPVSQLSVRAREQAREVRSQIRERLRAA